MSDGFAIPLFFKYFTYIHVRRRRVPTIPVTFVVKFAIKTFAQRFNRHF